MYKYNNRFQISSSLSRLNFTNNVKSLLKKIVFLFIFFVVGFGAGFYLLLSGYLDKPYTYIYRTFDNSLHKDDYKFSPVLKEKRISQEGQNNA